jgi:hypothetical protein
MIMLRTNRWVLAALVATISVGSGAAFAAERGAQTPAATKKGKSKPAKPKAAKKAKEPKKPKKAEKTAKAPAGPAVVPRKKDYGSCPPGPPDSIEQAQGRKADPRCAALGDPGSMPCKKDTDCPGNSFSTDFEACVDGCCLLRCGRSASCLWDQVCREQVGAKGARASVCMHVETVCPAYSDANACDGKFDDAACDDARVCVHRTKCDVRGQCCSVVCATDADCIDGGRCHDGLCRGR